MTFFTLFRIIGWAVFVWIGWRAIKFRDLQSRRIFGTYAAVLVPNEIWYFVGAAVTQPLQGYVGWGIHAVTIVALIALIWQVLKAK